MAYAPSFVNAIVISFRKCTDTGKLPLVWKSANLSVLFKSGSKTDPFNHKPVSLTCILCSPYQVLTHATRGAPARAKGSGQSNILCKVYEKILRDEILIFVESKISPDQHGFV